MSIRSQVLSTFKKLHRTRLKVFEGDVHALAVARDKINTEYRKNVNETDTEKLNELLTIAVDSERLLRTTVVQGEISEDNVIRLKVTKDTYMEDNAKFDPNIKIPVRKRKPRSKDNPSSCS